MRATRRADPAMTRATRAGATLLAALLVASLLGVALVPAGQNAAAQQASAQRGSYVVEQGTQCRVITPLSGGTTAAELYEYRDHDTHDSNYEYSSHGTTQLQRNDTSSIFLYDGPEGTSLVIVHDRLKGGTGGGAAEFEVIGLPTEAEWTVRDDDYSDEIDDVWRHGDVWSRVAWLWAENRTDGGVVTGLGDDFEVTIDPAFNNRQSTYDRAAIDGTVGAIHVLSGDVRRPDRVAMPSTDEPIVIRSGSCEDPTIQYERTQQGVPASVTNETGEAVARTEHGGVLATVEDSGGEPAALRPPATGGNGIQYDRLSVVATGAETPRGPGSAEIGMRIGRPPEIPESNEEAVPLSALAVDTTEGSVNDATLTFGVDTATLEEHGASINDVTVYREHAGGAGADWQRTTTRPVGERDGVVRFEAEAGGDGRLAVVLEEPPITATDVSLDRNRIEAGETVEVTATVENASDATETAEVALIVFGEAVDSRKVTLEAGGTETLSFEQRVDSPGTHTIEVADESQQLEVAGDGPAAAADDEDEVEGASSGNGYPAIGVGALVALLLLGWWYRSPQE